MARRIKEGDLTAIEDIVKSYPISVAAKQIAAELKPAVPLRTLQHRLKFLVENDRLLVEGKRRSTRYLIPKPKAPKKEPLETANGANESGSLLPLSKSGSSIKDYVHQPQEAREPVGYKRAFLESYRPNETYYLSQIERAHLHEVGKLKIAEQPAGTYARQILNRLLIDLSWNSSRLEGNTYSLLDTKRLIEFGEEVEGKAQLEAQMILNHKDAIEFLVGSAEEISFNRITILNLHAMLANNLLPNESAVGKLRHIGVGIENSVFHPLEAPQLIEECFDRMLATATAIKDPFEQGFFVMVQIPYLQPFDDVNKRVSRLSANIPLLKRNLSPLSFIDVPRAAYIDALLGVYELNATNLLKDVFIWAYERSAKRYAAVRQSLGEPDPFRFRCRAELRDAVRLVILGRMDRGQAIAHLKSWTSSNVPPGDREQFLQTAESDLFNLHEGNFARYQIKLSEFTGWLDVWQKDS